MPNTGVITPNRPSVKTPGTPSTREDAAPHGATPQGGTRPYTYGGSGIRPNTPPPHRSEDRRYNRPRTHHVRPHPHAHHAPPRSQAYRHYYTRWYCHPYYRYQYSTTVVVWFDFYVSPWDIAWVPPRRDGWVWVAGYWSYGNWHPGFWRPVGPPPRAHYVYVPGWWDQDVYVEGYYRAESRPEWEWVEGYYLSEGTYVQGHWRPTRTAPEGYTWEPGFWDGESYVDGFWRPEFREGYRWISSYYDADGIFHSGFWEPLANEFGFTWIPGWFDGNSWVDGYWVRDGEFEAEDVQSWQPEEGWNDGWEVGGGWGDGEILSNDTGEPIESFDESWDDEPLAIPVPR